MGWNDHHPGISPDDPDPAETLLEQADLMRDRAKHEGWPCVVCGELTGSYGLTRCKRCRDSMEYDRLERESNR